EGANMPCTLEATTYLLQHDVLVAPSKASNAGGVSVSGLEMSQNGQRVQWTIEEVDLKLRKIMKDIHAQCLRAGKDVRGINYIRGANLAAFRRVIEAMRAQGIV